MADNEFDMMLLELWGADDCYFFEEELCEWFGKTKEELRSWLLQLSVRYPQRYKKSRNNRQAMAGQMRFENRNIRHVGDRMDTSYAWGTVFTPTHGTHFNTKPSYRRTHNEKS